MGFFVYLLSFWGLSSLWHYVQPVERKRRRLLKMALKNLRIRLLWDADLLEEDTHAKLQELLDSFKQTPIKDLSGDTLKEACTRVANTTWQVYPNLADSVTIKEKQSAAADAEGKGKGKKGKKGKKQKQEPKRQKAKADPVIKARMWTREFVELFAVVFGVVAGLRGLAVQPFQIPTGSMQPTLYGIHFEDHEEVNIPSLPKRIFDWVNFSTIYVDATADEGGELDRRYITTGFDKDTQERVVVPGKYAGKPIFPKTEYKYGDEVLSVPWEPFEAYRKINDPSSVLGAPICPPGWSLARGHKYYGDHLFVSRFTFYLREPKRGDITVFITDGLRFDHPREGPDQPLNGRYYIKRLVALPGDHVRITDRKLYIKKGGEGEFELVDADDHVAFERMYSFKGGYKGYSHGNAANGAKYLTHNDDVYVVPEDHYLMLGDNSESSLDGRYFGAVPRKNLVGTAAMVWWPISRRWGRVDIAEPIDKATPPSSMP